ncbi:hypothetical protein MKW92_028504 [Papaver armeniacum]|nr:hypothetical protein MKW92_028504 [Papaver armeniacum]
MFLPRLLFICLISCWYSSVVSAFGEAKPGCQAKCGNITIPYPFGITVGGEDDYRGAQGCSIHGVGYGYNVNCNTSYDPPKAFIGTSNLEILSISETEIRKKNVVAALCYNMAGALVLDDSRVTSNLGSTPFTFSNTKNRLFAIGCNSGANILGRDQLEKNYSSQCVSLCASQDFVKEGSCDGSGCCMNTIPKGIKWLSTGLIRVVNVSFLSFNPCSYAFLADQEQYTFSASDLMAESRVRNIPVVLDWAVGSKTCEEAQTDSATYACQDNSYCSNSENNPGYRCTCHDGYKGNPYISPGCQVPLIAAFGETKPGCQARCGNISIPYPFGITVGGDDDSRGAGGCSIHGVGYGYNVNCNTSYDPPKAFIGRGKVEILSISETEIRQKSVVAALCYNMSRYLVLENQIVTSTLKPTPFTFSNTKNSLFTIGCNSGGAFLGLDELGKNYSSQCVSVCNSREDMREGSCNGSGCCQNTIQKGINTLSTGLIWIPNNTTFLAFNRCSYAFLADREQYTFSASDLLPESTVKDIPVVLDWAIGIKTCEEAKKDSATYACQENTYCKNSDNNPGYRCTCHDGYTGNPYLSPGCKDLNECEDQNNNPCDGICINTNGSYNCTCPTGSSGDGRKDGKGCTSNTVNGEQFPILSVTLGNYPPDHSTYYLSEVSCFNSVFSLICS